MKIQNKIIALSTVLLLSVASFAQDKRTVETKVADLLAQFPANDLQYTDKLMVDMISLGESGIRLICDQIIPAGTSDDTRVRFAVQSLSRYLSQKGKETEKSMWEKICISYATVQKDNGVKDFFMKQLQLIGSDPSVDALKVYLSSKEICGPALAAITAIGGKSAETALAEALKNRDLPCAAAVMNALALMKSQLAVNEYIEWTSDINVNTKASAYNALAQSGSLLAYSVLSRAAKGVQYRWEHTGATASLLNYAKNVGQNGDIKTMDKICKLVMAKCKDKITIQNKIAALEIYTGFHGIDAMKELKKAVKHADNKYRNAALRVSLSIAGKEIVQNWIDYFSKAIPAAKPEIITALGIRGDELALPLITASLSDPDFGVRKEAALALAKISGSKAVLSLIDYMVRFSDSGDQETAKTALMSVMGSETIALLKPVLKDGTAAAKKSAIELMAWNKSNEFFSEVLPYVSFADEPVKSAAFKALGALAGSGDQTKLIEVLSDTDSPVYIADVQSALAVTAVKISDPEKRSGLLINSFTNNPLNLDASGLNDLKMKVIPVLARTGGREALSMVLKEFESGNSEMREVCFKTLTSWLDYSASSALYEICASGNKTYEAPAFEGYVRQVRSTSLPDEQKLLLYRKIMPYARSIERKNQILTELGKLKTYQTLFLVGEYLDDPGTSAVAAKSAMHIALPSVTSKAGMYGTIVKDILLKAMTKLAGSESEYDREMISKYLEAMPPDEGFKPMFNGRDLTGWQGLVENPLARAKMKP